MSIQEVNKGGAPPEKPNTPAGARQEPSRIQRLIKMREEAREAAEAERIYQEFFPGPAKAETPRETPAVAEQKGNEVDEFALRKVIARVIENSLAVAGSNDKETTKALEKLADKLEKLDNKPPASQLSGLKEILEAMQLMSKTFQEQAKLGGAPAGVTDLPSLVELKRFDVTIEQAKIEHVERMKKLDQQMEEQRQQWQADRDERKLAREEAQKRWEHEQNFKEYQWSEEKKFKQGATESLQDLVGAALDGIQPGVGAGATNPGFAAQISSKKVASDQFPCETCGTAIQIPEGAQVGDKLACPNRDCSAVHELMPKEG